MICDFKSSGSNGGCGNGGLEAPAPLNSWTVQQFSGTGSEIAPVELPVIVAEDSGVNVQFLDGLRSISVGIVKKNALASGAFFHPLLNVTHVKVAHRPAVIAGPVFSPWTGFSAPTTATFLSGLGNIKDGNSGSSGGSSSSRSGNDASGYSLSALQSRLPQQGTGYICCSQSYTAERGHSGDWRSENSESGSRPTRTEDCYRQPYEPWQRTILEREFQKNPNVDKIKKKEIASKTRLTPYQVKVWFQNNRTKMKKLASKY